MTNTKLLLQQISRQDVSFAKRKLHNAKTDTLILALYQERSRLRPRKRLIMWLDDKIINKIFNNRNNNN